MKANANSMSSFNTNQERARRRRNRNVTMVLFGIVLLFLLCHIGEVAISIYELADVLDGERSMFPQWASNTIILNHLLIVINSSLNFVNVCTTYVPEDDVFAVNDKVQGGVYHYEEVVENDGIAGPLRKHGPLTIQNISQFIPM